MRNNIDWTSKLDQFGRTLLSAMGHDYLPSDHNPILESLRAGEFVQLYGELQGFNKSSVARAAIICQMAVYDNERGPDGDGEPKALRRSWYGWFKTRFAQQFSAQMGEAEFKDLNWNGLMSTSYGYLVDNVDVTYENLWVADASRMMKTLYTTLFSNLQVVVAVEKDSLYKDFVTLAENLGARAVVSGKGKMSKAGTEALLRQMGWGATWSDPFQDQPLVVLTITDWDYDGKDVIAPTFATQARRYLQDVREARIGVTPEQVADLLDSEIESADFTQHWYNGKIQNQAYIDWSEEHALFAARCYQCDHEFVVKGTAGHSCPRCGYELADLIIMERGKVQNQPMTFEVEALKTRDFAPAMVNALVEVLGMDYIIERLREECTANADRAVREIEEEILAENEQYQALKEQYDAIARAVQSFEGTVREELYNQAEPHEGDWADLEDDPSVKDFQDHVQSEQGYTWRPFSEELRTRELTGWVREHCAELIRELKIADVSIE